jgi:hypothetical protein
LGMGLGVAYVWTDETRLRQTIAQVPLQPGRSPMSDTFCTPLLQEYERQWLMNHNHHQEDDDQQLLLRRVILSEPSSIHPTMKTILAFASNCRHRQVMEQQLRDQRGILLNDNNDDAPMEIPETGVIPQSEDPLMMMMLERQYEHPLDDDDTRSWNSINHVQSWVRDQQEE